MRRGMLIAALGWIVGCGADASGAPPRLPGLVTPSSKPHDARAGRAFHDDGARVSERCTANEYQELLACLDVGGTDVVEVKGQLIALVFADARVPSPRGVELVERGLLSDGLRTQLASARGVVRKALDELGDPWSSARFEDFTARSRPDAATFTWSMRGPKWRCRTNIYRASFTVSDAGVTELAMGFDAEEDDSCCDLQPRLESSGSDQGM